MSTETNLKGFALCLFQLKMLAGPVDITVIGIFINLFPCTIQKLFNCKELSAGMVTVDKLIVIVKINLGTTISSCTEGRTRE